MLKRVPRALRVVPCGVGERQRSESGKQIPQGHMVVHGPFNTTADSELPSETTEGEPKPETRILLLLKQCIHMESGVPSGSAVKNPPAVKEMQV